MRAIPTPSYCNNVAKHATTTSISSLLGHPEATPNPVTMLCEFVRW